MTPARPPTKPATPPTIAPLTPNPTPCCTLASLQVLCRPAGGHRGRRSRLGPHRGGGGGGAPLGPPRPAGKRSRSASKTALFVSRIMLVWGCAAFCCLPALGLPQTDVGRLHTASFAVASIGISRRQFASAHVMKPQPAASPPRPQATQQLVDFAVAAVRDDARPQYAAAWSRLKAALLAAAAAAHPAAAADAGAAAVRADSAAREWMAAAADIFDAHLPDKAARAAAAKQVGAAAAGQRCKCGDRGERGGGAACPHPCAQPRFSVVAPYNPYGCFGCASCVCSAAAEPLACAAFPHPPPFAARAPPPSTPTCALRWSSSCQRATGQCGPPISPATSPAACSTGCASTRRARAAAAAVGTRRWRRRATGWLRGRTWRRPPPLLPLRRSRALGLTASPVCGCCQVRGVLLGRIVCGSVWGVCGGGRGRACDDVGCVPSKF
jgi:hypothetical protein